MFVSREQILGFQKVGSRARGSGLSLPGRTQVLFALLASQAS